MAECCVRHLDLINPLCLDFIEKKTVKGHRRRCERATEARKGSHARCCGRVGYGYGVRTPGGLVQSNVQCTIESALKSGDSINLKCAWEIVCQHDYYKYIRLDLAHFRKIHKLSK